jgi:phage terminase large subunit
VRQGIQAVKARLRDAGDGKPRLFILRDALVEIDTSLDAGKRPTCTLEEFPGYVWRESKDGRAEYEEPLKVNDHGMDALRYAVMYVDSAVQPAGGTVDYDDLSHYKTERRSVWR